MARPDPRLARQEVTEARIAAQPLPRGKPWAEAIRIRALECTEESSPPFQIPGYTATSRE